MFITSSNILADNTKIFNNKIKDKYNNKCIDCRFYRINTKGNDKCIYQIKTINNYIYHDDADIYRQTICDGDLFLKKIVKNNIYLYLDVNKFEID